MRFRMSRAPRPAGRGDTGAALVEFAFVATILCALVGGAWDYGQGWRAGLTATEATRTGVRVGSSMGNDVTADFEVLTGMRANLSSSDQLENVERVVIFRVNNANNGEVPTNCKTANAIAGCHIIPGNAFRAMSTTWNASDYTSTGCLQAASGRGYCPTDREDTQIVADTIGVYVRLRQDNLFGLIGDDLVIERNAAMRLEP